MIKVTEEISITKEIDIQKTVSNIDFYSLWQYIIFFLKKKLAVLKKELTFKKVF